MNEPWLVPILFHDDQLIVVAKPVGLATTAPDGGDCLVEQVRLLDPNAPQLHPLSRLDTQVSGIVCFARTASANQFALAARQAGTFRRRYLGLTPAVLAAREGAWEWPIAIDTRDPRRRRALPPGATLSHGAKLARTEFVVRGVAGIVTALDLYPITGRTHQLRVHASAAGAPLFGDVAYGGVKRCTLPNGRIISASRVMLHCVQVSLPRGPKRAPLSLTLPPPEDMCRVFAAAGGEPATLSEAAPRT